MNTQPFFRLPILMVICMMFSGATAYAQSKNSTQASAIGLETGKYAPVFALRTNWGRNKRMKP